MLNGLISSFVISFFHLVSSIALVALYVLAKNYFGFSLPYVNYIAGGALLLLGLKFLLEKPQDLHKTNHGHMHENFGVLHEHFHTHENGEKHAHLHEHVKTEKLTLSSITVTAFVLGFAHEEEFALLALAVGGIDPLVLMLVYAFAVMAGLIGITLASVKFYKKFERHFIKYELE